MQLTNNHCTFCRKAIITAKPSDVQQNNWYDYPYRHGHVLATTIPIFSIWTEYTADKVQSAAIYTLVSHGLRVYIYTNCTCRVCEITAITSAKHP